MRTLRLHYFGGSDAGGNGVCAAHVRRRGKGEGGGHGGSLQVISDNAGLRSSASQSRPLPSEFSL